MLTLQVVIWLLDEELKNGSFFLPTNQSQLSVFFDPATYRM